MRLSKSTFVVLLTVILVGSVFTGVTTAQQSEEWCLNVADDITESVELGGCDNTVISTHDNVSVEYDRTTPSTSNDLYFLPTIVSNTRQAGTLELALKYTPTGETVDVKTIEITGEDTQQLESTSLVHDRSNGGNINSGDYEAEVTLKNERGEVIVQKITEFEGFYMSTVDESTGGTEEDDTAEGQSTSSSGTGTVVPEDVDVQVSEVITDVSRYNDQTQTTSTLQDTSIPPLVKRNTSTYASGVGVFENFSNMRERENPTRNDAAVRSVNIDGRELINVGTVTYGIPQARNHRLVLTYSMQAENPVGDQKIVGVELVDSNGEVIDDDKSLDNLDSSSPRWLDDTVQDDVDTTQLEQLENADEDILNEESVTINLTDKEESYINNNYQAHIVYRTAETGSPGGLTVFKPFRAAIYSTDASNLEFSYQPEKPVAGEEIQFNVDNLPESFCSCSGGTEETGEIIWDFNGTQSTQSVTVEEYEDLKNNPDSTLTGPTHTFGVGGTKEVVMRVRTPENQELQRTRTISVFGEGQNIQDTPATFDVSYEVLNELNPKYGSVDVPPTKGIESLDKRVRIDVTVQNTGNSEIRREVALMDTMLDDFGYEDQVRDTTTVNVEPESSETVQLTSDWTPAEYGRHEVYVVEYKDGEAQRIPNQATGDYTTNVYVQQPATLKIRGIIAPDSHYVYDNFTGTAKLENVGDLSTKHPASHVRFEGEFTDTWSSVRIGPDDIPDIAGGEVRDGTPGETKRVSYERDYDYTPNYPEFLNPESTGEDRTANDSPWTDKTTQETGTEFPLQFRTKHMFAESNVGRFQELNDSDQKDIRIYKIDIIEITEDQQYQGDIADSEAPSFAASAYKFTEDHYTSNGEVAVNQAYDNDQTQWENWNSNAIPTSNMTDIQPLTTDSHRTSDIRYMDMRVALANPGTAPTGTARIKVVSDRTVHYPDNWETPHAVDDRQRYEWFDQKDYSDKVVGVAGIDLEQWENRAGIETAYQPRVRVPIVIPNHPENEGVHTLTVKVRHKPDYIETYEAANQTQLEFKVDVGVWGDSMYISYENMKPGDQYEQEVFQNCTSPNVDGLGNCLESGETNTNFDFVYRNVGGAPVTQTIDAHFYEVDPSNVVNDMTDLNDHFLQNADQRAAYRDRLTSEDQYDNTDVVQSDFWEQNITQTLSPAGQGDPYQIWTFNHDFVEPGLYEVQPYQWRYTANANRFPQHHLVEVDRNQDFSPQNDLMAGQNSATVMVWDDMDPISRHHPQDCTQLNGGVSSSGVSYNQCLEEEYNGLDSFSSGTGLIWEGGAVRFDGEQRERWDPSTAQNRDVSSDNVGVDKYTWELYDGQTTSGDPVEVGNRVGNQNTPAFIHRFDEPGYYTLKLTVEDHGEYVDGQGEVNTNTHIETFLVEDDQTDPDVNIYDLECGNTTDTYLHGYASIDQCWNSGGPTHVWSSGAHTDGAHVSWAANINDNGVGIESLNWSTDYSSYSLLDDSDGNFHGSSQHPTYSNDVEQRESGDWYATDQKNFQYRGGSGDSYDTVTINLEVTDFSGRSSSDSSQIVVVSDDTNANTTCLDGDGNCYDETVNTSEFGSTTGKDDGSGSGEVHTNSASAQACVEFTAQGPNNDGIGFDLSTLSVSGDGYTTQTSESTIVACVSPSVSPSASASCSVSCSCSCDCNCGSCGTCSYSSDSEDKECDDDDSDTDSKDHSSTITVEDYHGNQTSASVSAYVEATAYDYDDDSCSCSCSSGSNDCGKCEDDKTTTK